MRRMGERGSVLSRHRFDLASLTDRLEQIYREAQRLDGIGRSEGGQAAGGAQLYSTGNDRHNRNQTGGSRR